MHPSIDSFIAGFSAVFPAQQHDLPWEVTQNLKAILEAKISGLDDSYTITEGVAVHRSATVERHVVLKAPVIVSEDCFIGAHAYLRGGVFMGKGTVIGTGCEVKSSVLLHHSAVAHFNFIGDSLIGSHVNFEAGAIVANHFNERPDKQIQVMANGVPLQTGTEKFGALVGDRSKIGANAVLSPGTLLAPGTIVGRLELVAQGAAQ
ncbi:LpxA family transferase [Pontibacter sp. E15-1]|uniref:DapH/DapD/GlmU-related protein n=1 Tax=Pontibacter sp. E15-1 TaxID=2919918 RepID=UPI001F4FA2A5|nr:DapH/DapD/GlmU-related protein [Pontibacter sp. E15-1]MCJ8164077.1 LpxA family transferase [Pontibacter sp. E15-1]